MNQYSITLLKNKTRIIALVGNPNSGKSSLFNQLTGLRQKTGNFPGVTVEKKTGTLTLTDSENQSQTVKLIDFPGIYSIYPKSTDEKVVMEVLANPASPDYPDVVVVVADASNLQRNLLLYTEIADLGFQTVLALNMLDVAASMNLTVNAVQLAMQLNVPVVNINARTGEGAGNLKDAVAKVLGAATREEAYFLNPEENQAALITEVKEKYKLDNSYLALQYVCQHDDLSFIETPARVQLDGLIEKHKFEQDEYLAEETIERYNRLKPIVAKAVKVNGDVVQPAWTKRLDAILLHKFWGYVMFMLVLLVVFQAVFSWASYPMDLIDGATADLISWVKATLPEGLLNDLLTDGLLAGIGGVVIFIPQIAFLFALVALLEESGYMARVMVIMDKLMRKFGLNGKSVVPLISGVACAVPAVMSARSISSSYERLLTILVTPIMSCSARLPIYTILIALVVPEESVFGFLNLQGLVLFGLYFLGLAGALLSAWLLSLFIERKETSYFILEIPTYKMPRWNHVGIMVLESVKSFVFEAGKVIVAISIILWVLASYGPGDDIQKAEDAIRASTTITDPEELDSHVASVRLENSYAGSFGRFLEPAIRPLGYDWKIGIALITSFAAREVFVGTMATIYSIGGDGEDVLTVKERLRQEKNLETGGPRYTPAVCYSLMVFYVFAMMCMSTLAAVYRETKGWKWPMIQLVYLMGLAYLSAFAVYQLMS